MTIDHTDLQCNQLQLSASPFCFVVGCDIVQNPPPLKPKLTLEREREKERKKEKEKEMMCFFLFLQKDRCSVFGLGRKEVRRRLAKQSPRVAARIY